MNEIVFLEKEEVTTLGNLEARVQRSSVSWSLARNIAGVQFLRGISSPVAGTTETTNSVVFSREVEYPLEAFRLLSSLPDRVPDKAYPEDDEL
jgi:hypothetical protein